MSLDPEKIFRELESAGIDYADKDAAATLLEETKKSVLSDIKGEHPGSDAAAETKALSDQRYKEHITKMVEARRLANRAKVRFDALKTLAELRRTEESTRRAEINLR